MKKKKRNYTIVVLAIICIVAIVIIYNMFYEKGQTVNSLPENKSQAENFEDRNNNEIENTLIENENKESEVLDNSKENEIKDNTMSTIYEQNNDIGSTDRKQEAINLVKQKWGEDSTVTFRCDSITNKGEYIIAVISKNSAVVQNYFKVNLETKTVVVDY